MLLKDNLTLHLSEPSTLAPNGKAVRLLIAFGFLLHPKRRTTCRIAFQTDA